MKGKRKLTRRELARRKRRRRVIRNRIIFGVICLLLFVAFVHLVSWIVTLLTGGNFGKDEETTKKKTEQVTEEVVADYPENRRNQVDYGNQTALSVGIDEVSASLNPLFGQTEGDETISRFTQLYLISRQSDGSYGAGSSVASFAYEFSVNPKGVDGIGAVYEFVLKNQLQFSDGIPMTVDDLLFTMYVVLDSAYDGTIKLSSLPILGLEDYQQGKTKSIEGILVGKKKCEDGIERDTIQVITTSYHSDDLSLFEIPVLPQHCLLSKEEIEAVNRVYGVPRGDALFISQLKQQKNILVGAGSYQLCDVSAEKITLKANPYFCLGVPLSQDVNVYPLNDEAAVNAVRNESLDYVNIDLSIQDYEALIGQEAVPYHYVTVGEPQLTYMGINAFELPDLNVRKALLSVMNKELIYDAIPEGVVSITDGVYDKDYWAYSEGITIDFDETGETAKKYLEESGYVYDGSVMGIDGYPLTFFFSIGTELEQCPAGAMLDKARQILETIGCSVQISVREDLENEVMIGDRSIFLMSRSLPQQGDISSLYYTGDDVANDYLKSIGFDYMRTEGTEFEKQILGEVNTLFLEASVESDYKKRQELYGKVYEGISKLAVELPLYQKVSCSFYKDNLWPSDVFAKQPITAYTGIEQYLWNLPR